MKTARHAILILPLLFVAACGGRTQPDPVEISDPPVMLFLRMTNADRVMQRTNLLDALENAPNGKSVRWKNDNTETAGWITPLRTETNRLLDITCREYVEFLAVGGKIENYTGTACRDPSGNWIINQP